MKIRTRWNSAWKGALPALCAAAAFAAEPVAHWTFDEPSGAVCRDVSGHGFAAAFRDPASGAGRIVGLFGGALQLEGGHRLACVRAPDVASFPAITVSAWAQPRAFDRYNEILRKEDGDRRILFSFQENGRVLSLGLNVGGYAECDAKLDPARVLDGEWHHCAATFDGRAMRVYLDGAEIGRLERPGAIAAGGGAALVLASSEGHECFQGGLDDLRLYDTALGPQDVAQLHAAGLAVLLRARAGAAQALETIWTDAATFAETLAAARRACRERKPPIDAAVARAFEARLRARFPEACAQFREWTGAAPAAYLRAGDEFQAEMVDRLLAQLVEYRPLTERQRARQTDDERRRWDEAAALERRFGALRDRGDASRYSPEWIDLALEIGRRIQWRPKEHESVAPFVVPDTPAARQLTAAEARAALERDWLFQAGGRPTRERIASEIAWARDLAARSGPARFAAELAALDALEQRAAAAQGDVASLYFEVRDAKRRIQFGNPAIDFDRVVFVDMPYPAGKEWPHETRHRQGYMAVPGARLMTLEGLRPDGRLAMLMPQAPLHGSFWRPDVSFDGRRVLFCFKPHNEKSFHLYEIGADGSGLRQLTDGPFDDLDPVYLPDGRILFCTMRAHTYVRCMPPTSAFVLARCDPDGGDLRLISANNEPDYLPSVMEDGRVVYTRWEYTDKPLWRAQKLWTVNPDGTQVQMFWGNQSVWPDVMKDARVIPGSRRVMFTGCGHHNWFAGSVGIVDPGRGRDFPDGLTKITADVPWPECGNGPTDPVESPRYHASGAFRAYYSPYPLTERDFLVSAERDGKFALYLMDVDGNRELIHEGTHHIFHAMPLRPRPAPPVLADRVDWPGPGKAARDGVLFSGNVYQGAPAELRGRAKFLRVLHIDPKTYTYWYKRPYISTGPVVSGVQSEGVKRILGTVPVEPDGSVSFRAPPGKALHFQLLDGEQRALQTMRSFVNVMPGEYRGCLGCHEAHSRAPLAGPAAQAAARTAREIAPPPWPDATVSYARYVRPVLDRYCAKCHEGGGEGRAKLDLTARPGMLDFDETYWLFTGRPAWGQSYAAPTNAPPGFGIADTLLVEGYDKLDPAGYRTPAPMTRLSYASRLVELVSSGRHHGVRVDPESRLRLICWVDAMCPYRGDEEVRQEPDPVFQGVEWLAVRPRIRTAPVIDRFHPPLAWDLGLPPPFTGEAAP